MIFGLHWALLLKVTSNTKKFPAVKRTKHILFICIVNEMFKNKDKEVIALQNEIVARLESDLKDRTEEAKVINL